jgi:DNA-binding response OmpR family regulator
MTPFASVHARNVASHTRPRRVLVIDPDPDWRQILRLYLSAFGYQVLEATDAEGSVGHGGLTARDLIVAELHAGVRLLARRDPKATCEVPVVIVTTRAFEVDRLAAIGWGAASFLQKPCSLRSVATMLDGLAVPHDD